MYVEFSGRQTGKSTRLVDHAADGLIDNINDNNYFIAVVATNRECGERLRKMIIEKFLDKIRYMGYANWVGLEHSANMNNTTVFNRLNKKILIKYGTEPNPTEPHITKHYVDEFAFIESDKLQHIDWSNYYCTTPNGNQEFSLRLIDYCKQQNVDIVTYDMSDDLRESLNHYAGRNLTNDFYDWCASHSLYPRLHPFSENKRIKENLIPKGIQRHKF